MTTPRIFVFTDADLDGSGAYLYLTWVLGINNIPKKISGVKKLRLEVTNWLETNKFSDYDKVFFLDLDTSEVIDLIDHTNVVIVDHHKTHLPNKDQYKNAKIYVEEYTSSMKYMHSVVFKNRLENLTLAQKRLILLVDDYDSYALQVPGSLELNLWFWAQQGSRIEKFLENFSNGFNGFTFQQENLINQCKQEIKDTIDEAKAFKGIIDIGTKRCTAISLFADKHPNEVAQHILKNDKPDIIIIVNLRNKAVYVRSANEDVDCSLFAAEYLNGGGHKPAAGGLLTEEFMELTKKFVPTTIIK